MCTCIEVEMARQLQEWKDTAHHSSIQIIDTQFTERSNATTAIKCKKYKKKGSEETPTLQ